MAGIARGTRLGWWRLAALLLALVLVAAACGASDDDAGSGGDGGDTDGTTAEEDLGDPVPGGTLRFALEAETDGLNPTTNAFAVAALQMGFAVFDPLAIITADGEVQPHLAEEFVPNDDYTQWDVVLRPGITFHDGEPLDAQAVKVNAETALADPLVSIAMKPVLDEEQGVEVVDDLTARFFMDTPTAQFPSFITGQLGMLGSPKWIQAALDDPDLNQEPVGTGPFVFESRIQDNTTTFVRNDDWWGSEYFDGPNFDKVEFVIQTDPTRRAQSLEAGDLNAEQTSDPEAILRLRDTGFLSTPEQEDNTGEESFVMINTESPPFDDIRVREALTLATPKEAYLEIIGQGVLVPTDTFIHESHPFHNPDVTQATDDPDAAAALVEEYCGENPDMCTDGKVNMSFKYTGPDERNKLVADTLIDGWSEVFDVTRDQVFQDDYIQQVALGQYQVVTWRQFGAGDPDADATWIDCRNVGGISLNWPRNCNEETQELLLEQRSTEDDEVRAEAWRGIQENINEDFLYVFIANTNWAIPVAPEVKNLFGPTTIEGDPALPIVNGRVWLHQAWIET